MKKFAAILLLACPVLAAESYLLVSAQYHWETYRNLKTLTIYFHNNGAQDAACDVKIFDRERTVDVPANGDASVSFSSLPEGELPHYSCQTQ
jgi:hypothetical protein